jgi:hypothetical protein
MIELIPFVASAWFAYFFKNNRSNNFLTGLLFLSYIFFATNYTNFGLDFSIFRYTHRLIGSIAIITLIVYLIKNREQIFKETVPILLTLFFLALLASFFNNEIFFAYYYHYVRNFIFLSGVVLYLYYFIDTNQKLDEISKLIISLTLILAIFTIFEVLKIGWGTRVSLLFPNPNYLGIALLPGLVFLIFSPSKYFWIGSIIIIIAIFATGSRASELSSLFIILTFVYNKKYKKMYLLPIVILMSVISVMFFAQINFKINDYSNSRLALARISLNIFQEHPINGIGYGQFRKFYYKYIDEDIINLKNSEMIIAIQSYDLSIPDSELKKSGIPRNYEIMTHNDLLTIISELGLIGILCLVFLFYKLYIELKKLLLHSRNYFFLSISLIGSTLIFSLFHNNMTAFIFWFTIFYPFIVNRNFLKTRNSN